MSPSPSRFIGVDADAAARRRRHVDNIFANARLSMPMSSMPMRMSIRCNVDADILADVYTMSMTMSTSMWTDDDARRNAAMSMLSSRDVDFSIPMSNVDVGSRDRR
jgi:hypothetical protein